MLCNNAVIKGDAVDQIGKTGLIIVLSLISIILAYISYQETGDLRCFWGESILCTEVMLLALLQNFVNTKWKCIPIIHYTVIQIGILMSNKTELELSEIVVYFIAVIGPGLIAAYNMLSINEDNQGLHLLYVRMFMSILILISIIDAFASIIGESSRAEIMSEFFSLVSFYISIMVLSLPRNGYLNIRRILITICIFFVVSTVSYSLIVTAFVWCDGERAPDIVCVFAMLHISIICTFLLCHKKKKHPVIIDDQYNYTLREKVLKAIGWSIADSERFNKRKLLEEGFKRDFVREYIGRFYCEVDSLKDIAMIQHNLAILRAAIDRQEFDDSICYESEGGNLVDEGVLLLGKLSLLHNLDTGINNCPIQILISGCDRGEKHGE